MQKKVPALYKFQIKLEESGSAEYLYEIIHKHNTMFIIAYLLEEYVILKVNLHPVNSTNYIVTVITFFFFAQWCFLLQYTSTKFHTCTIHLAMVAHFD